MKKKLLQLATIMVLCGTSGMLAAAETHDHNDAKSSGQSEMLMGKHVMSGTIEDIDHKTGWIKLKTGVGDMKIHFPAPSINNLNSGDKITVNLSFSVENEKMDKTMGDHKM
jgi:hypothetical protein